VLGFRTNIRPDGQRGGPSLRMWFPPRMVSRLVSSDWYRLPPAMKRVQDPCVSLLRRLSSAAPFRAAWIAAESWGRMHRDLQDALPQGAILVDERCKPTARAIETRGEASRWLRSLSDPAEAHAAFLAKLSGFGRALGPDLGEAHRLLHGLRELEVERGVALRDDVLRRLVADCGPEEHQRRAFFAWAVVHRTGATDALDAFVAELPCLDERFLEETMSFDFPLVLIGSPPSFQPELETRRRAGASEFESWVREQYRHHGLDAESVRFVRA